MKHPESKARGKTYFCVFRTSDQEFQNLLGFIFHFLRMFENTFANHFVYPGFFQGVLGTRFGSLKSEKIGSLESE